MAHLNATQLAAAGGQSVLFGVLVEFGFSPSPLYMWDGLGPITISGKTYLGGGELVSISDIEYAHNDIATKMEFTLSGVTPEVVALAKDAGPLHGAEVWVWGQFFSETLQPFDSKFYLGNGVTDIPIYRAKGATVRSITITVEGDFTERNGAAYAYFSDRDQQARFSGDLGLQYVPLLRDLKEKWPY